MDRDKLDFALASHAFDKTLYKSGRKRTRKDEKIAMECFESNGDPQEIDMLKRHNMISYNFVKRELMMKNAPHLFSQSQPDFFFPLPKTGKVLMRLVKMWNIMAYYCRFPPSYLTVLTIPHEPWSKKRCLAECPLTLKDADERVLTYEELRERRADVVEDVILDMAAPHMFNGVELILCT